MSKGRYSSALDSSDNELIKAIQQNPALYDPSNPDFKFMQRKEEIWTDCANYLGICVNDLKRRWTCLRDKYTRELKARRLERVKPEPSPFFDAMDFLRKFVRKRSERKSIVCNVNPDAKHFVKKEEIITNDWTNVSHLDDYQKSIDTSSGPEHFDVMDIVQEDERPDSEYGCETYEEYGLTEEQILQQEAKKAKTAAIVEEPDQNSGDYEEAYEEYHIEEDAHISLKENTVVKISQPQILSDPVEVSPVKTVEVTSSTAEDEFFCKSVSVYLANLKRINKIRAKVEIFQILQKYVELEEEQPK